MSTFICDKCGAIDNTAISGYWNRCRLKHEGKLNDGYSEFLCSKCNLGKWHDKFPREHWSKIGFEKCLEIMKRGDGSLINARQHFRDIGVIGSKTNIHEEVLWEE